MITEAGFQPRKENSGTKVPLPNEDGTCGTKVPLPNEDGTCGTKVPLPNEDSTCGTKVPLPNISGTEVPPPKEKKSRFQHLPHIDLVGYYQFVTFRTFDSVDEFIRKWDFSPAISNKEKQQKIDEYLDISTNGAYLQDEVLEWLFEFLLQQDKKLYELVALVIMNNHVHILFKPLQSLSKVMQMIKGVSAKKINEILGKNGRFWADDYYDKAIRDEKHFWVVYEYIKNNPLKIGGTKVPLPNEDGTGGTKVPLPNEDGTGGTKVPLPNGNSTCGTKVPLPNEDGTCGTKVPLPRFYGIYE